MFITDFEASPSARSEPCGSSMPSNFHPLPMVHVNELLQKFESTHDLGAFLAAFEVAVESRLGRQQFLRTLQRYIDTTPPSLNDLQKLVVWAEQFQFTN